MLRMVDLLGSLLSGHWPCELIDKLGGILRNC